ncbi:uncharacterized protein G2W53_028793 [Senna tora]|uniref:Uncharacterized protein n=1 Tax=Senna tora TaxID=362788 RepID=A0A834T2Y7_9FABA|nr:uncharacterized protein G2W53_028793 [Senna tora]
MRVVGFTKALLRRAPLALLLPKRQAPWAP